MPTSSSIVEVFGIFHYDYEGSVLHSTYATSELAAQALENITGPKTVPEYAHLYSPNFDSWGISEIEVLKELPPNTGGFYIQLNENRTVVHLRWNEVNTLDVGHYDYRSYPAWQTNKILFYGCGKTVEEALTKVLAYIDKVLPELESAPPVPKTPIVRKPRNQRRKNA